MSKTVTAGELFHTVYAQSGDTKSVAFIMKSDSDGNFIMETNEPNIQLINRFQIESGYGYGYGNNSIPDYATILSAVTPTNLFDVYVCDVDNVDLLRGAGENTVSADGTFSFESDSTLLSISTIGKLKIISENMGDSKMATIKIFYK